MKKHIRTMAQLLAFRKDVRDCLKELGLPAIPREEILLAATELGTNLIRHGGGGTLEIIQPGSGGEPLTIISSNTLYSSPPSGVLEFPTGLGFGLDSLERLMDRVEISRRNGIFRVVTEKDLRRFGLKSEEGK